MKTMGEIARTDSTRLLRHRCKRTRDDPRREHHREKRREDAMRADLRGMSRLTWSMVMPDTARRTMADLARALDQSYRLYVRGRSIIAG